MRTFKNLLLSVASVLVFLVVAETALWFVVPPVDPHSLPRGLLVSTVNGWALTPGMTGVMGNRRDYRNKVITVDRRGLRNTPAAGQVPNPIRRIHLLGDSQTMGHGLNDDETWANRLQSQLIARGRGDIKVENYGVPGINIDQYNHRLPWVLAGARSGDLVLVGMSWNDLITPQSRAGVMRVVKGYLVKAEPGVGGPGRIGLDPDSMARIEREIGGPGRIGLDPDSMARIEREIGWQLWLYERTGIAIPRYRALKPFVQEISQAFALGSLIMPHIRGLYFARRSANNAFQALIDQGVPARNFWLLYNMLRKAEAKGVKFAVLFLPSRYFFEDEVYRIYSQNGKAYPVRNYQGHIALPLCRRFTIDCLDTFDVLVRHNREGLVFPLDGHYNPRGARLIGDFVADAIAPWLAAEKP